MSNPYYLQGAQISTPPLIPGSIAYQTACDILGLATPTSTEIAAAFAEEGWFFECDGDCLTNLLPDDDQEIPDPDDLDKLTALFTADSYVEFENGMGEFTRKVFRGGGTQDFDKLEYLPAAAFTRYDDLTDHIAKVTKYLAELVQQNQKENT